MNKLELLIEKFETIPSEEESKFLACAILPICVGGCSQRLLENSHPHQCPLGFSSENKQQYAYRILSEKLEQA